MNTNWIKRIGLGAVASVACVAGASSSALADHNYYNNGHNHGCAPHGGYPIYTYRPAVVVPYYGSNYGGYSNNFGSYSSNYGGYNNFGGYNQFGGYPSNFGGYSSNFGGGYGGGAFPRGGSYGGGAFPRGGSYGGGAFPRGGSYGGGGSSLYIGR